MRKLKLIWDFRGPSGLKVAEHHHQHLKEFLEREQISVHSSGFEPIHELHAIAFIVVDEMEMKPLRDALKPHRGEIFQD